MNVLLTTDTIGGVWTYALELAHSLSGRGVRIALATMGAPLSPDQRRQAQRLPHVQVFESAFRLEWMRDPWRDVQKAGDWLLDVEREFRPDVIHLNGYAHGSLHWRAPVLVVAHSCVLSWWRAVKGCEAPASWDCYRDQVRKGIQAAQVVVAPSQAMLAAIVHHYGPLHDARVIYNARNPAPFGQPRPKEELILSAGRIWDEAKNVAALASVAPRLAWPVCVAGEDRHRDGQTARHPNVRPLGKLSADQLAPWFARASIYALPARYEPFGLTALEAALSGCALVLGDIPSLREIWGDDAMLVAPHDTKGLERALCSLIENAELRQQLGQKAKRSAQRFAPSVMARSYLNLYQEMIERGAAPHLARTWQGRFGDQVLGLKDSPCAS